jgi:hypothetical protein
MLVIVPPQSYFQVVQNWGYSGGFVEFYFTHYLGLPLSLIVAGDPTNGRNRQSLAAIIAVDVVGYYRLMGEDEAGTARIELIHSQVASGCQTPPNGGMLCVFPRSKWAGS